jgi:hypothetical protein
MKRTWKLGLGLILLAALAAASGVARAEPASAGDKPDKLDERIDMTLKNAAPDDLFGSLAKLLGPDAVAVVDPAVRGPVVIELHNVRARTLLDAVCESIGCRWSVAAATSATPPKLLVVPLPAKERGEGGQKKIPIKEAIDFKVTRADGRDVLRTFGEILSADVVVEPGVAGQVTLELENLPVDQTLDAVCKSLGCEWSLTEGANGRKPVLRVWPKKK